MKHLICCILFVFCTGANAQIGRELARTDATLLDLVAQNLNTFVMTTMLVGKATGSKENQPDSNWMTEELTIFKATKQNIIEITVMFNAPAAKMTKEACLRKHSSEYSTFLKQMPKLATYVSMLFPRDLSIGQATSLLQASKLTLMIKATENPEIVITC